MRVKSVLKGIGFVLAYAVLIGLFIFFIKSGGMQKTLDWVASIGLAGNFVIAGLAFILVFPFGYGWAMAIMASGYCYGFVVGVSSTIVATFAGTAVSILLCRKLFRGWIRRKIDGSSGMKAVITALEQHSTKFMPLLRVSPLTVGMQNAIIGVSNVKLWKCLAISYTILTVQTCVFTFLGSSTIKSISDIVQGKSLGPAQYAIVGIGGATVVTFLVAGTIIGRRAMNKMKEEGERGESERVSKDHDVSNDDSRQDSQDQQSTLENGENFYNLRRRKSLVSLSSARYDYSEEEHLLSKEGDTNQQALSSPDPQRRRLSMDYDSDDDSVDMLSIDSLIGAPAKPASATKTMRSASVH